jgi:DNA-binding LacI/PurR family transcriptional regulator
MRVSIKDIAEAAGVSHSTVSRALSDSPLVKDETKARIKRLAEEMGYSPDAIARSLVTQKTRTVGVVVTTITDPFVAEVVQGVEDTAQENDYSVILASSASEPESDGRLTGGERALHTLTDPAPMATAVFCYNDLTAIGLISSARQAGLSVPHDLAVVGFDDIPLAAHVYPRLTTIAQPQRDMGRQAMDMALALMTTGNSIIPFSDVVIKGKLVVRESSGVGAK